jgi:hypothetical protein
MGWRRCCSSTDAVVLSTRMKGSNVKVVVPVLDLWRLAMSISRAGGSCLSVATAKGRKVWDYHGIVGRGGLRGRRLMVNLKSIS